MRLLRFPVEDVRKYSESCFDRTTPVVNFSYWGRGFETYIHSQNKSFSFSLSSSDRVRALGETTVGELALQEIIVLKQ